MIVRINGCKLNITRLTEAELASLVRSTQIAIESLRAQAEILDEEIGRRMAEEPTTDAAIAS